MTQYPLTANRALVQPDQIAAWVDMAFGYSEVDDGCILIRGLGEKGTPQEAKYARNVAIDPRNQNVVAEITKHAMQWAEWNVGCFVVPAIMSWESMEDASGVEERVVLFTTIVADVDCGDTDAKVAYLRQYVGQPTMIVASGGHTPEGQLKYHVWWKLAEVTDKIQKIAKLRKTIALKIGCDTSFGRAAQVVRIPGTVWAKGGNAKTSSIIEHTP